MKASRSRRSVSKLIGVACFALWLSSRKTDVSWFERRIGVAEEFEHQRAFTRSARELMGVSN